MSKSDFLSWDNDIDLDLLLGDYTEHDEDDLSSDDENLTSKPKQKKKNSGKENSSASYKCPVCNKILKTISGFRGHTTKQHCETHRASDNKILREDSFEELDNLRPNSVFRFDEVFEIAFNKTVINISNDKFLSKKLKVELEGLLSSVDFGVQEIFRNHYSNIFDIDIDITLGKDREQLFRKLHKLRTDSSIKIKLRESFLQDHSAKIVNTFVQLVHEDIVGEILSEQLEGARIVSNKLQSEISDNDQNILFYISGYIIRSLLKKYHSKPEKIQRVETFVSNTDTSSFIKDYSKWVEKQDRGGLKKPTDVFYLLVRELEIVVKSFLEGRSLSASSLLKVNLQEAVMESFMVKHYCNSLMGSGDLSLCIFEDIVRLFLTIRGFAMCRVLRNKMVLQISNAKRSSSLRQTLKETSVNSIL